MLFCPVAVLLRKYFSFSSFFAATQKSKATDTNDDKNLTHTHLHTCGEKPGPLKTLLLDSSHLGRDAVSLADEQFGGTDAVQTVRKTTHRT